ncbi:MAG TPA: hypothetical protein PKI01_08105 [Bacteroidales bacterium]|nr:hypothetical protein [Bacteroidales bacterium]
MNNTLKQLTTKTPAVVLIFSLVYFLIVLFSCKLPMFWDMSYITQISNIIYDSDFTMFYSDIIDNGSSPIYSIFQAFIWSLFGRSLPVTHFTLFPFLIGIVYQFMVLAKRFVNEKYLAWAFLFLIIEPTLLTQTVIAGYDLIICFLFLLALNGIFQNKKWMILLPVVFIPLINIRGFSIVISIFLIDVFFNKQNFNSLRLFLKNTVPYIVSLLFLLLWMSYHYYLTGWFFHSHLRGSLHQFVGMEGMAKNLFYNFWKLLDFGRIFIVIMILILSIKIKMKDNPLLMILLISLVVHLVFFLPLAYPVSHRHFMHLYPIMILLFCSLVSALKVKWQRITVLVLAALFLVSGNLWVYPERFGNGWDSSLKSLSYFKQKEQLDNFIKSHNIPPAVIGTKWPMNFDDYDTKLGNAHFMFSDIETLPLKNFEYIAQSNISNNFTPNEIKELNTEWILEKHFYSWPVYINLFKNPIKKQRDY